MNGEHIRTLGVGGVYVRNSYLHRPYMSPFYPTRCPVRNDVYIRGLLLLQNCWNSRQSQRNVPGCVFEWDELCERTRFLAQARGNA
jgi:hypothetical protein